MTWYEDDVKQAETKRLSCTYTPETVFYGSSTFTLWDTMYDDFAEYKPINLGFGGSTLAACVWFFDRIVAPLQEPKKFLLYAGDNDLGDGRRPEEVCLFYREFVVKLREHFPHVPCYFISIKPSISREGILDEIKEANHLISEDINKSNDHQYFINIYDKMVDKKGMPKKEYFEEDGLHLNPKAYAIWKEVILKQCLQK